MSLCNFFDTYGMPPEDCSFLREWLYNFAQAMAAIDNIRSNESTIDATDITLSALWGGCDVPAGAFVVWYNSTSGDTHYFSSPSGVSWFEVVIQ